MVISASLLPFFLSQLQQQCNQESTNFSASTSSPLKRVVSSSLYSATTTATVESSAKVLFRIFICSRFTSRAHTADWLRGPLFLHAVYYFILPSANLVGGGGWINKIIFSYIFTSSTNLVIIVAPVQIELNILNVVEWIETFFWVENRVDYWSLVDGGGQWSPRSSCDEKLLNIFANYNHESRSWRELFIIELLAGEGVAVVPSGPPTTSTIPSNEINVEESLPLNSLLLL